MTSVKASSEPSSLNASAGIPAPISMRVRFWRLKVEVLKNSSPWTFPTLVTLSGITSVVTLGKLTLVAELNILRLTSVVPSNMRSSPVIFSATAIGSCVSLLYSTFVSVNILLFSSLQVSVARSSIPLKKADESRLTLLPSDNETMFAQFTNASSANAPTLSGIFISDIAPPLNAPPIIVVTSDGMTTVLLTLPRIAF